MAENLQFLGDEQNAWRDRLKAIALLDRIRTPLRRLGILEEAVATCSDQRLPRTASHFSTAAVDVAGPLGPLALSDVLIRRARLDHGSEPAIRRLRTGSTPTDRPPASPMRPWPRARGRR